MSIVVLKNVDSVTHVWNGQSINAAASYTIQDSELKGFANNDALLEDIANGLAVINDGTSDIVGTSNQIDYLKGKLASQVEITSQIEPHPFAAPTFRTKRNATSTWVDCLENATTHIDFLLTEERYVSGGEIIYKNAKKGDYVTASVYDKDSVIPAPYRAALCEAHPVVAEYISKKWVIPSDGFNSFEINTYPLNAKVTAGLYLRVSYVATSEAGTREAAINYHLTKKL